MLSAEVLLLFAAASAALSIAPGPDNIFVLTQSAIHGSRTGVLVTLGLCTGLIFHITMVILGIAAVLKTSIIAFTVLKIIGAAYLLYLAWQSFRAGSMKINETDGTIQNQIKSARALYLRGIFMNITNPKVAIFFLAFFPQFTNPAQGSVTVQVIILGVIFMLISLVVFVSIALLASQIGVWLKKSAKAQIYINRLAGTIFVFLACRLALSRQ